MTESKIHIDEAISRISTTLIQHGETIQTLKKTLEAFPLPDNTQFNTFRDETQQEFRNLESKLTATIAAKSVLWPEITNNTPLNWSQFVSRFLAQLHSLIRVAQQEQEWSECKQQDNETINEFVVRLRSIWLEQRVDEQQADLIKHLFCKMRPDMLNIMSASRSSTLNEIITEAQHVEEILYLRNKELRLRQNTRNKSSINGHNPTSLMSIPTRACNSSKNTSPTSTTQANSTCWRCYETGHYAPNYPLNDSRRTFDSFDNNTEPLPPRPKNN
ncbi:unnamed protein product [Rotaria magnacalcarata]|uniref:Retrotransposon gag domain-containing protein n=3 Tax=Rotaria magnacalcarata TaxID=392030 RepID=A0A815IIT0_9BILA|nr:unnamed protein product [Rotaria magnacalcarata]CAF1368890.1 unnamed protein product [Rotaria magnacalcarata]CAF4953972.1 unnamed protein product [Rotaria magnacalcarata]